MSDRTGNEGQPNFLRGALVGAGTGLVAFAMLGAMLANNPKSQINFDLVSLSFFIITGAIIGVFALSKSSAPDTATPSDPASIKPGLAISKQHYDSAHEEKISSSWSLKTWRTVAIVMHIASGALLGIFYVMLQSTPSPSLLGIAHWLAVGLGTAIVPLAVGVVGLLYKPDRKLGYIVVYLGTFIIMFNNLLR